MINIVNIDLTNNSCWGTANAAGADNEINLFIKLLDTLLDKTDIQLEFTKPDGALIITDNLSVIDKQVSYEIPFSLYVTEGTLKLRILATGYTSEYINFVISSNLTETDDICVKFDTETREFKINKCVIEDNILLKVYPIGSIYMSVNNINPSNLFGGTWETWGTGRVPVGVDTTQTEFETVEKTGGEKTHTLTVEEMPAHNHTYGMKSGSGGWTIASMAGGAKEYNGITDTKGEGKEHNNLQPYITCYMWKRID